MQYGYAGKILRVDLTQGKITEEGLPPESTLRKFFGGLGLGLAILDQEQPVDVRPLDPENRMIFMTGPLTGTPVLSANNCTLVTVNHETGYTVASSHTHGYFAPYLKFAGYDGMIIQGAAEKPCYLYISAGKVELRDASHIWGKDTHETEDLIKDEIGDRAGTTVAAIGPAGENLISGSAIGNDKHHLFAKGGGGEIMGSKKLKAIAISSRGGKGFPVADPQALLDAALAWHKAALSPPVWMSEMGGPKGVNTGWWRYSGHLKKYPDWHWRYVGTLLAVKNLSDQEFGPKWGEGIYTEAPKFKTTAVGCFSCPRGCTYATEITTGPYKGVTTTLAGGGENMEGAAGLVGITEPGSNFFLTDLYDRLGLDGGTTGSTLGLAFECYERGIITKADTDGLELKWGNTEAAVALLHKIVRREGFGALLTDGPKKAAERIGGDAPKYAVHIKGAGMNMHDWRSAWSVLLAEICAGAGPTWQGNGADAFSSEPDLGYPELSENPVSPDGKAEAAWKTHVKKLMEDSLGICWFAAWGVPGILDFERRAIAATTGWKDITVEDLLTLGHRVSTLQKLFSMKRGWTIECDLDIGQRLLDEPESGFAAGKGAFGDHVLKMIKEYYAWAEWDPETGIPLAKTIKRLGLQESAKGLEEQAVWQQRTGDDDISGMGKAESWYSRSF
jgi:aldehyde:ferredoxin oxidoreductase